MQEPDVIIVGAGHNGLAAGALLAKRGLRVLNLEKNRFASAELHGKLLNAYADIDSSEVRNLGRLKQLVAGDSLQHERKYQDPFSSRTTARLLFSANTLPLMRDETNAMFDRLIPLEFPYRFEEKEQDKDLIHKLTTDEEIERLFSALKKTM